jgi:hypothetical protein
MQHEKESGDVGMSSTVGLLGSLGRVAASTKMRATERTGAAESSWVEDFAAEQTRGLVRQVFFPGWPRPARQVVFSGVDDADGVAQVCLRVAQELARQIPAKVCVVQADRDRLGGIDWHALMERIPCVDSEGVAWKDVPGCRIAQNLWAITAEEFLGASQGEISVFLVRDRLAALRRDFEYAVINAAPALHHGETALLGQAADGVVLVLNANETRRVSALKAKAVLGTANARLVGTVLNRRFSDTGEALPKILEVSANWDECRDTDCVSDARRICPL